EPLRHTAEAPLNIVSAAVIDAHAGSNVQPMLLRLRAPIGDGDLEPPLIAVEHLVALRERHALPFVRQRQMRIAPVSNLEARRAWNSKVTGRIRETDLDRGLSRQPKGIGRRIMAHELRTQEVCADD